MPDLLYATPSFGGSLSQAQLNRLHADPTEPGSPYCLWGTPEGICPAPANSPWSLPGGGDLPPESALLSLESSAWRSVTHHLKPLPTADCQTDPPSTGGWIATSTGQQYCWETQICVQCRSNVELAARRRPLHSTPERVPGGGGALHPGTMIYV